MQLDHVVESNGMFRRFLRRDAAPAARQQHADETAPQDDTFHFYCSSHNASRKTPRGITDNVTFRLRIQ